MASISVGDYVVMVPDSYTIEASSQYRDIPSFLRHLPFDWEVVKQSPTVYTVRFGEQWLSFNADTSMSDPEKLSEFVENMTRHRPVLENVETNGIAGKACGGFSDDFSCRAWWFRATGSHVVMFNFQGPGVVSEDTKAALDLVIGSLRRRVYLN